MHTKRFSPRHLGHITGWVGIRQMPTQAIENLPEVGFIVFEDEEAVCAMFLRRIEGGFALLDSAISNPHIAPAVRRKAQDMAAGACIRYAKEIGLKQVMALTVDANVKHRCKDFGFEEAKDVFFVKKLV